MAIEIVMPRMGLTMESGTVVAWLKRENEPIDAGEPLLEIETDKSTVEIESPASGVLARILTPVGESAPVGTVIGYVTAAGEASPYPAAAARNEMEPQTALLAARGKVRASPAARQAARRLQVDLGQVEGTGPNGRVVAWNVHAYAGQMHSESVMPKASPLAQRLAEELAVDLNAIRGSGPGGRVTRADVARAAQVNAAESALESENAAAAPTAVGTERLQLSTRHLRMAERMASSFGSAPHFYLHVEVDARRLVDLRRRLLEVVEKRHGVRITYTDFLIYYCGLTLRRHPEVLRQWAGDALLQLQEVNLGVAIDTPNGLVVPVIAGADRLRLGEIAIRRQDLAARALVGKLLPNEMELGGFTLTNLGMYRIDSFDAVLNPPQAAILAIGRIKERAIVEEGSVLPAPMLNLSLSVDHRVLDGAAAARFLGDLVEIIENPDLAQV